MLRELQNTIKQITVFHEIRRIALILKCCNSVQYFLLFIPISFFREIKTEMNKILQQWILIYCFCY